MIFSVKKLSDLEKEICSKTISSKAIYALVGDAVLKRQSMSVVRMGDGERKILDADPTQSFLAFEATHEGWNRRLGIEEEPVDLLQREILEAGNECTYFAPSISGISYREYFLHQHFRLRSMYIDNFFVNDWTDGMVQALFEASDGVYVLHRDYRQIIQNFQKNYRFTKEISFDGCTKDSWKDNGSAIEAATRSSAQLVLYSGGPGGKIIGPRIAQAVSKVVLDVGNTLLPWSEKRGR